MRKIFRSAFLALAVFASQSLFAQVSHGGEPLFNHSTAKATINTRYLPEIDNDLYLQQDINGVKGAGPMRVSIGQQCDIDVLADAKKSKDDNGVHYTLAIQSPGATFVTLKFSSFQLADGAELYIYDETGEFVLGKFVKSDVMKDGRFFTQSIPGNTAYIEYNVPAGVEPGKIVLSHVLHGYKDIFGMIDGVYQDAEANLKGPHGNAEGTCHPDVICPEGDGWRDQIRSVVALSLDFTCQFTYGGRTYESVVGGMCTGSVINNTSLDRTPYILSAFHCQDGESLLEDLVRDYPDIHVVDLDVTAYFLYEKYTCGGAGGSSNKSMTGAEIVAKYNYNTGSDMLLLRLNDTIPSKYKPYYAGWDREVVISPEPGACIHHPGGDFKKISLPKSITADGNFYKVSWFTGADNKGVTEQGSSGSPLFNADKRIVGQLYAGSSFCNVTSGKDYYGRLSTSWEGGGLTPSRLKSWLDPIGSNVSYLDGLDYPGSTAAINNPQPSDAHSQMSVYPNPSDGMVHFDVDYLGKADYKVFDLSGRCVKEGSTVLTSTVQCIDLRSLPKGSYVLSLWAGSKIYSAQIIKQ